MKEYFGIMLAAMLTDNFVLSKFMGICPFLGVSKKASSSLGMGAAVTFVMVCAAMVTYPIYHAILVPLEITYKLGMEVFLINFTQSDVSLLDNKLDNPVPPPNTTTFFIYITSLKDYNKKKT